MTDVVKIDDAAPAALPALSFAAQAVEDRIILDVVFRRVHHYELNDLPKILPAVEAFIKDGSFGAIVERFKLAGRPANKAEIAAATATLVGMFPNAPKSDLTMYVEQLAEELAEQQVSIGVLNQTVRAVRQECRFLPSIAEVVDQIRKVEKQTNSHQMRIENLERRYQEAIASRQSHQELVDLWRERGMPVPEGW